MRATVELTGRDMRPLVVAFAVLAVGCVVAEVVLFAGVSPLTLLAVLFAMVAGTAHVSGRKPLPVLSADERGVRLNNDDLTPWEDIHAVVLVERDEVSAAARGSRRSGCIVLAAVDGVLDVPQSDADDRVAAWCAVPGALGRLDAARVASALRRFRPGLQVIDAQGEAFLIVPDPA